MKIIGLKIHFLYSVKKHIHRDIAHKRWENNLSKITQLGTLLLSYFADSL